MDKRLEKFLLGQSVIAEIARRVAQKCVQRLNKISPASDLGKLARTAEQNDLGALIMIGVIGEGRGAITAIKRPDGEAIRKAARQLYLDALRART